jgi:hypothetical protein
MSTKVIDLALNKKMALENYQDIPLFKFINTLVYLVVDTKKNELSRPSNLASFFCSGYLTLVEILILIRSCRYLYYSLQYLPSQLRSNYAMNSLGSIIINHQLQYSFPFLYWISRGNFVHALWIADKENGLKVPHIFESIGYNNDINHILSPTISISQARLVCTKMQHFADTSRPMMKLFAKVDDKKQKEAQFQCIKMFIGLDDYYGQLNNLIEMIQMMIGINQNVPLLKRLHQYHTNSSQGYINFKFMIGLCISGNVELLELLFKYEKDTVISILLTNFHLLCLYVVASGHEKFLETITRMAFPNLDLTMNSEFTAMHTYPLEIIGIAALSGNM